MLRELWQVSFKQGFSNIFLDIGLKIACFVWLQLKSFQFPSKKSTQPVFPSTTKSKHSRLWSACTVFYPNKYFRGPGCHLSKNRVLGTKNIQYSITWIDMDRYTCQNHIACQELDLNKVSSVLNYWEETCTRGKQSPQKTNTRCPIEVKGNAWNLNAQAK